MEAEKRPITAEDLWKLKRLDGLEISPDRHWLAYLETGHDIEKDTTFTRLCVLNIECSKSRYLTASDKRVSQISWSPDSSKIAFIGQVIENKEDKPAIYVIPVDGGESERIFSAPLGVEAVQWFPCGERILFASRLLAGTKSDFDLLKEVVKEKKESKVTGKATENRVYRFWDHWTTIEGEVQGLFSLDLDSGETVALLPGFDRLFSFSGDVSFDLSPKGDWVALSMDSTPPPNRDRSCHDIYLLKTDGSGELINITEDNKGGDFDPHFNPSGDELFFCRTRNLDWLPENARLYRYVLKSKELFPVTADLDLSVQGLQFSEQGDRLYFHAEDRGQVKLFSVDSDGSNFLCLVESGSTDSVCVGKDRLYFLNQNFDQPNEIYSVTSDGNITQLSFVNKDLLEDIELGEVEECTFTGANEDSIHMWIIHPPGFSKKKRYPLVQLMHGGPHTMVGNSFNFRWNAHVFAAEGYVLAWVNRHGSTGFGDAFSQCIVRDWPTLPFEDIMKGTDFLLDSRDYLDSERMAAAGGSYGGYMAAWVASHTDRFKCIISHAGVHDLENMYAGDVTHWWDHVHGGRPWQNVEKLQRVNPAACFGDIDTPMLVIHGENDYRVPVGQGFQLYGALQSRGIESRLLYFPDENHWILKPANSIFWNEEFAAWLKRFIG